MVFHIWNFEIKIAKSKECAESVTNYLEMCKAEQEYMQKKSQFVGNIY